MWDWVEIVSQIDEIELLRLKLLHREHRFVLSFGDASDNSAPVATALSSPALGWVGVGVGCRVGASHHIGMTETAFATTIYCTYYQ